MVQQDHIGAHVSPAFRAWLDDVSYINPKVKPRLGKCDNCETEEGALPFVGNFCVFCAGYFFGRYEKSAELAKFAKLVLGLVQDLSVVDLAQEIHEINWNSVLPLADSDETTRRYEQEGR